MIPADVVIVAAVLALGLAANAWAIFRLASVIRMRSMILVNPGSKAVVQVFQPDQKP